MANRTVHCADALTWLAEHPLAPGTGVLTSLPDAVEFTNRDADRWTAWFGAAAEAVLRAVPDEGAAVFFQTDVKRDGRWTDKAFLIQLAARTVDVPLVWHKVVCRAPAGRATGGRPGYAHLLCFSRGWHDDGEPLPDVLPELGSMAWSRAMGRAAADLAVGWLRIRGAHTLVAPFCGTGTALDAANALGMTAIGIERNPGRAAKACGEPDRSQQ
ncbi:MAG: hypothetical protein RL398_634 [Planctomycetota bacterium]